MAAGFVLIGTSAFGAEGGWSLSRSLDAALSTHPSILARQAGQRAAEFDRDGARWARYPTASLEVARPSDKGPVTTVRIDQPLWTGGRITAGIEAASHRHAAADAATLEARREITLKVSAAWLEALRSEARAASIARSIAEHEKLVALISRRVEQEVSPAVDLGLARSRLLQTENEASFANQTLTQALNQLAQLVGEPVARVLGDLDESARFQTAAARELAVESALNASPTLKRLGAEERASASDVDARRAVLSPQLALRLERFDNALAGSNVSDRRALLVLSAQPGAGLSAVVGVEAALAKQDAAKQATQAAQRELVQQVGQDWIEWAYAQVRLANARESLVMAREVFDSYTRQYAAGRKTWLEVLNAVREANQTELALIDAKAQAMGAALRLMILTGEGLPRHEK